MAGFVPGISLGETVPAARIYDEFKCQRYKGIMASAANKALVVVADREASVYLDRWDGDVLHYTGAGAEGDQSFEAKHMNNGKLRDSKMDGTAVYLFEKFAVNRYVYRGIVELCQEPYMENQLDKNGAIRKVCIFPLKLTQDVGIDEEDFLGEQALSEKQARRRSDEELLARIQKAEKIPGSRMVKRSVFQRNPDIAEYAVRRAKGTCDRCLQAAPFLRRDGNPYLEAHHIVWLSEGGTDDLANVAALCPNCHKRMHVLDDEDERAALLDKYK